MARRNPDSRHPVTLQNRKSPYANREEEQADRQTAMEQQLSAWRPLLTPLLENCSRIPDPRRPGSIRHKATVLMVFALFLYPNGPFMALCRQLKLDFMLVLPQNSLPTVWEEVEGLRKLDKDQTRKHTWGDRQQEFWWVNQIGYDFKESAGSRWRIPLHVVGCTETWQGDGEQKETHWAWVSSRMLTAHNVVNRCNRAARRRWAIYSTH